MTKGRYLLEKKTKLSLTTGGVRVVSCAMGGTVLVIGQSNGVFGVFDVDTLENIHSF